jgi:hypothetical protein
VCGLGSIVWGLGSIVCGLRLLCHDARQVMFTCGASCE